MVGERLGCRVDRIRKLFPELVAKVAARALHHKSKEFRKKRTALDGEVLAIARQLSESGIPPRYDCVIPMLSKNSLNKWDDISRAIQKARRTLGLEPAKSGPVPRKPENGSANSRKSSAQSPQNTPLKIGTQKGTSQKRPVGRVMPENTSDLKKIACKSLISLRHLMRIFRDAWRLKKLKI